MKLPFNQMLSPLLKPYLGNTRVLCQHSSFSISVPYTYFYGTLGFLINANHLRKHFGETPAPDEISSDNSETAHNFMVIHDLKIIATSMGLAQYACLLVGCFTENPALFLPHLIGQLFVVAVKILNLILFLCHVNFKSIKRKVEKEMMENESNNLLNQLRVKHENHENEADKLKVSGAEHPAGVRMRLRALLVALLGVSMSACALASQPVELELDDDEVAQRLNNVSFARRITKPTIRLVMGYGKMSAFVTAASSLLLLVAVMSKQSWWRRGARWLAAPALLVAALEATSDAGDAMLAAALRGTSEPARIAAQTAAAAVLVTIEILVWYFIAKFFEYNPPTEAEEKGNENIININPQ